MDLDLELQTIAEQRLSLAVLLAIHEQAAEVVHHRQRLWVARSQRGSALPDGRSVESLGLVEPIKLWEQVRQIFQGVERELVTGSESAAGFGYGLLSYCFGLVIALQVAEEMAQLGHGLKSCFNGTLGVQPEDAVVGCTIVRLAPGKISQVVISLGNGHPDGRLDLGLAPERLADLVAGAAQGLMQRELRPGLLLGDAWPRSLSIRNRLIASALAACKRAFFLGRLGEPPVPGDTGEAAQEGQYQACHQCSLDRLAAAPAPGRASGPTGRAAIGRPSRQDIRSSANCQAVSYRRCGSLSSALATIVARSTGTARLSYSGTGSSSAILRKISCRSVPVTAGRNVKSSYRVPPRE